MQNKERGAVSWLMEFAGEKRIFYIVSVIAAIIGVICSVDRKSTLLNSSHNA